MRSLPSVYPIFPVIPGREREDSAHSPPLFSHTLGRREGSLRLIPLINLRTEPRALCSLPGPPPCTALTVRGSGCVPRWYTQGVVGWCTYRVVYPPILPGWYILGYMPPYTPFVGSPGSPSRVNYSRFTVGRRGEVAGINTFNTEVEEKRRPLRRKVSFSPQE